MGMIFIQKIQTINARARAVVRGGKESARWDRSAGARNLVSNSSITGYPAGNSRFQGRPSHRVASPTGWPQLQLIQRTRPMGSHGGRRHRNGATLRAKLALEIPAVPLEVLALDGSLLYLFKSRGGPGMLLGSCQGARKVEGPPHQKVTRCLRRDPCHQRHWL